MNYHAQPRYAPGAQSAIAMGRSKKIALVAHNPTAFTVAKSLAGLSLIGDDVRDDLVLAGDTRMVFVRPDREPSLSASRTN